MREYDFINIPNKIFCERRSCYFFARRNEDGSHTKKFIGPSDLVHRIVSCGYEFIFTGSGSEILHGLSFTAHHRPLGKDAKNAVSAAIGAMGRFFSEEMAGQDSQFYSLRTGGHYRVFYGSPEGIKQLYFSINHWSIGPDDEPVVSRIVIPFAKDGFELSVGLNVETGWKMDSYDAVALAPLLESPRIKKDIQFNLIDVLNSELANFTFHICWRPDQHNVVVIPGQEPKFKVSDGEFRKIAHQDITIAKVKELLSG